MGVAQPRADPVVGGVPGPDLRHAFRVPAEAGEGEPLAHGAHVQPQRQAVLGRDLEPCVRPPERCRELAPVVVERGRERQGRGDAMGVREIPGQGEAGLGPLQRAAGEALNQRFHDE